MAKKKKAAAKSKKKPKQAPAKHKLTVEYVGICTLAWQKALAKKAGTKAAEMWLIDVAATGRAMHYPSLTIPTDWITSGSAEPDVVLSIAGVAGEFGGWDLTNSVVEIFPDHANDFDPSYTSLTPAEQAAGPKNDKEKDNLAWIVGLGELTNSKTVQSKPPITARVLNLKGKITALFSGNEGDHRFTFKVGSNEIGVPKRFLAWSMQQILGFDDHVRIEITSATRGVRKLKITAPKGMTPPRAISIGNLCRCADDGTADHFYSYYELLHYPQKPIVFDDNTGGATESDPEHCGGTILIDPQE